MKREWDCSELLITGTASLRECPNSYKFFVHCTEQSVDKESERRLHCMLQLQYAKKDRSEEEQWRNGSTVNAFEHLSPSRDK